MALRRGAARVERDSMGKVPVPAGALYGAQTQRAVENFPVSGLTFPRIFLRALGAVKAAAAEANGRLKLLPAPLARAIVSAARQVERGSHDAHFPVDVFQTGSGTSTNMNANEVIARLSSRSSGRRVHPNDHVNMSQSSNDVIPTALHVSAVLSVTEALLPALRHLERTIRQKARRTGRIVKTGRTHLMDAMPVRMGQELLGWADQVALCRRGVERALPDLKRVALGGTAVGTGINAHPRFARTAVANLSRSLGVRFSVHPNPFAGMSGQEAAVQLSGALKVTAVALTKIANDLRWMNSGPNAGLGEITLPALQPGSSIMPGKVNPVIPEAAAQVCAQVIGNDAAVAAAGASGAFELNVMLPVIAHNLLQSIGLLAGASRLLADKAIRGFKVNEKRIAETLMKNPILVTALNPVIGYEKGAAIAKKAAAQGRSVLEVAAEETGLSRKRLQRLLDPKKLTRGGLPPRDGSR